MTKELLIGFLLIFIVAYMAYKKQSLNFSGFFAAVFFGTIIYGFGSYVMWGSLISFFVSSSILTKIHDQKMGYKSEKEGRNYIQVISNASIASVFAILYFVSNNPLLLIAGIVSIASSNADTWASEIGVFSKGKTVSILTFKEIKRGESGGVSLLGTTSSLIGALWIGLTAFVLLIIHRNDPLSTTLLYVWMIIVGGFIGCLLDSYLGILLQAKYKGERSGIFSESKYLKGEKAVLISGFVFITNDMVNFLSALFASLVTLMVYA